MSLLDFTLAGSDPNAPNSFIQTPEQVAARQQLAQQLLQGGSSYAPVQSAWQGAARLGQALAGVLGTYKANQAQRLGMADKTADLSNVLNRAGQFNDPSEANIPATPGQTTPALQANDAANDAITDAQDNGGNPRAALVAALGGGAAAAPTAAASPLVAALGGAPQGAGAVSSPLAVAAGLGAGTPYGGAPQGGGDMAPYQAAIAKIESGGNYGAVGPATSSGDRAYGKYQVMGANIPQWTQAVFGRPMTPQEFLANPQAQDAVFNHQFGGYIQKYGPQDAASLWLTGRTLANGGARAVDLNGTTGQSYADQFTRNLGGAPASAAISAATSPHVPTWAEVQADNAAGTNAINAATAAGGGALPNAAAYAPAPPSPAMAGATPPGGPQGAGVSQAPAPVQADPAQLSGVDHLSPEAAASPLARPAVPPPSAPVAAPSPSPALAPVSAPAISPSPASHFAANSPGNGPDISGLLRVMSNPWASPAEQQVAQTLLQAQMPSLPTYGVIGKDPITKAEQYGWINPKTQTVTPANGGAPSSTGGPALAPLPSSGGAASSPSPAAAANPAAPQPGETPPAPSTLAGSVNLAEANGMTPQGAAYLNQMEAQGGSSAVIARQARAIINGGEPMPEGKPGEDGLGAAVKDAVLRAAPGYNSSLAAARVDLVKSFGDKASATSAGGQIIAANTGLHHLSALADSADKINNSGYLPNGSPLLNWAANGIKEGLVGSPPIKEFELNKLALAEELGKMYKGGSPAEAEVHALVKNLSPNMTPAEQQAAFAKVATLLQGKTVELQRQWQTAFGPKSSYPVIGDEGQKILQRFTGSASSASAPGASAPHVLNPQNPDADYNSLPSGAAFVGPDGHTRIKP